jgi:zinc transport system permease protein
MIGATIMGIFIALTLPWIQKRSRVPLDTFLGILLPTALGAAVILVSLLPGYQPELMSYLFGSILSTTWTQVGQLFFLCIIGGATFLFGRKQFLAITIDEEYAQLRGVSTTVMQAILNIFLVIVIVTCIQIVGAVLVTGLLVIPAVIATRFARSLNDLFFLSPMIAIIGVICGTVLSVALNIPTGPAIAALLGTVCFGTLMLKAK